MWPMIGSHDHHGVARLLGSTATAALHTADCDVLAVRIGWVSWNHRTLGGQSLQYLITPFRMEEV